jgi:cysteine desulfurase family protein
MIYLDNAATTFPKPDIVYENPMKAYRNIGVNFSRNNSKESIEILNSIQNLRDNILKLAFGESFGEVVFTDSATTSINIVLQGLDYTNIKNVYISPFEHNAVYRTLLYLKEKFNFNLEIIPFNDFELDLDKIELMFLSKTPNLVVCTHGSNVFGNILPVENIFELAKEYNAITILDSAQTLGLISISKLADFVIFSGHKKLYGFTGIGGFIILNKKIDLRPLIYGGTGIKSEEEKMPESIPEKFEVGTQNTIGLLSLLESTNWIMNKGLEKINKKKEENYYKLLNVLNKYNKFLDIYTTNNNIGIISVVPKTMPVSQFEIILDKNDIKGRSGLQCSPLAHKHIGTIKSSGTYRFSVSYFNSDEDFKNLNKVLRIMYKI